MRICTYIRAYNPMNAPILPLLERQVLQSSALALADLQQQLPKEVHDLARRLEEWYQRPRTRAQAATDGTWTLSEEIIETADRIDAPDATLLLVMRWIEGWRAYGANWREIPPLLAALRDLVMRCLARFPSGGPGAVAGHLALSRIARQRLHHHDIEANLREAEVAARGHPELHRYTILSLHSYLCFFGRAASCPSRDLLPVAYESRNALPQLTLHEFIDAVEAGRIDDAYDTASRIAKPDDGLALLYQGLLAIFDAVLQRRMPDLGAIAALEARLEQSAAWARRHLSERVALLTHDAPLLEKMALREDFMTQSQWLATAGIEAALARGQVTVARRRLEIRQQHGMAQTSDGALLARCLLLDGDRDGAVRALDGAIARAEETGTQGRLELDLMMAAELRPLTLIGLARHHRRPHLPVAPATDLGELNGLIGRSPALIEVRTLVQRFADSPLPVLVTGPSGVGKELVARALHEGSARRRRPLVVFNCGALAESLLESELFGHARGAFSGATTPRDGLVAEAGEGTLVLDEVGESSPHLQVALLRLLDYGEYRPVGASRPLRATCRFVFSTNRALEDAVAAGTFREDLLYRLRRLEIRIPPLAERREDILPIALHLLARIDPARRLSAHATAWLSAQTWPGNVRELRGALERACSLSPSPLIDVAHLQRAALAPARPAATSARPAGEETRRVPPAIETAEPAEHDPALGALERRLARAAGVLRQRGTLTRKELVRVLGISAGTATAYLQELIDRGLAERVAPNASPAAICFRWVGDPPR